MFALTYINDVEFARKERKKTHNEHVAIVHASEERSQVIRTSVFLAANMLPSNVHKFM